MTVLEVINEVRRRGIALVAHGDKLRYAPRSAVTPELREHLAAHKSEIMAELKTRQGEPVAVYSERVNRSADEPWSDLTAYTDQIPFWQEMLDYLEMPHGDSFGLQEKTRLDVATETLERANQQARQRPGDSMAREALEAAITDYKAAVDVVYALFKRTCPKMFANKLM
jgi:hypothetical protein